jgi:hypothetical protein
MRDAQSVGLYAENSLASGAAGKHRRIVTGFEDTGGKNLSRRVEHNRGIFRTSHYTHQQNKTNQPHANLLR